MSTADDAHIACMVPKRTSLPGSTMGLEKPKDPATANANKAQLPDGLLQAAE